MYTSRQYSRNNGQDQHGISSEQKKLIHLRKMDMKSTSMGLYGNASYVNNRNDDECCGWCCWIKFVTWFFWCILLAIGLCYFIFTVLAGQRTRSNGTWQTNHPTLEKAKDTEKQNIQTGAKMEIKDIDIEIQTTAKHTNIEPIDNVQDGSQIMSLSYSKAPQRE